MRRDWDASINTPIAQARQIHTEHGRAAGFHNATSEGLASHADAVMERAKAQRRE
jgi:hypothetical protein